ncbi:thiamine pyrophosphate-binding protein [Ruminococcus sp.]|jgi:2-succinyl-5-enolpyruvyl-6-hydroxy-3-cyclohexene-1-carboxylate synthase|uniref:thiamine pyrophosphate-binding protein n=1 Tax=Ruminococcus sp. TaxID=41978 RepID=UPI0025D4A521|nr:thiamine pyrophosphate-binding protein [Ruminococcus sp.]
MEHYYTNEINTLVLVSLLKAHNIKRIIASPGTTNISFVASIQSDPYFEVYSAVDERAAAFMACGLAEETGEPVIITCTGATASRNYIPGLTEAYYRHLPVLAVTASQHFGRVGNYVAQMIDRSIQFPDMIKKSFAMPTVYCAEDKEWCITNTNEALLELTHGVPGPIHINLQTTYSNDFSVKVLPEYRVIRRVINNSFPSLPIGKIGVFVGAHSVFTEDETAAIDTFCANNNAIVICDQISNYRGKYRFLANLVNSQELDCGTKNYDLIIYIGSVHGAYITYKGKQSWRVNPDGVIRDPNRNLTCVFEMEELDFFRHYAGTNKRNTILDICHQTKKSVMDNIPKLPFSNMWIAKETASLIPENSILHIAILNSLRVWNYFETPASVSCYSNPGGYGIDGCLSSFIGSALAHTDIQHFIIIGDLSFFYDLNVLLGKLPDNIHIMLINNGVGTEFKNYSHRAAQFGDEADAFIAAKGHNGFRNKELMKNICKNIGISYLSAVSKEEYLKKRDNWLNSSKSVVLEVFVNDVDESNALKLMNSILIDTSLKKKLKKSVVVRGALKIKRIIKKIV